MNKLERIKAIREELEILEEELEQEELKYPVYKQSIRFKQIVKFTGLAEGVILHKGMWHNDVDYTSSKWTPHTNDDIWKDIAFDEELGLYDKQLVWCYDNSCTHLKALGFYDAKNKKSYSCEGFKNGDIWDNYEPYEGDWPEWAKTAYETLED